MRTYNAYVTLIDGKEKQTQICGNNVAEAYNVLEDNLMDWHIPIKNISTCLFEWVYNGDDAREYGDEYEY